MPLKVMTWNVENLFRPPLGAPNEELHVFQQKLLVLSTIINQENPDVLALQEVGGETALMDLQDALGGTYPHRAISVFPDQRGIRVCFLSQLAIITQTDIVDFPPGPALQIQDLTPTGGAVPLTHMGRGALRIQVTKGAATVDIVTTHLKSKLLSFPRPGGSSFAPRDETERAQVAGIALSRRMAEAVTLRIAANGLLEAADRRPLLILGDVNDVPDAQTSLIFNGPPGSEIGTVGFQRPDQGDRMRLFNLAPAIAEDRRFSRIFRGHGELIDQMFASEEFFPLGPDNRRRLPVVDSIVDAAGRLDSIGEDPTARADELVPDHAPIVATFDM